MIRSAVSHWSLVANLFIFVVSAKNFQGGFAVSARSLSSVKNVFTRQSLGSSETWQELPSKKCLEELGAVHVNQLLEVTKGTADHLFRTIEQCSGGLGKLCKLSRTLNNSQSLSQRSYRKDIANGDYGCFPRICSESDIAAYASMIRKVDRTENVQFVADCSPERHTDIAFWICIAIAGACTVLAILGSYLETFLIHRSDSERDSSSKSALKGENVANDSVPQIVVTGPTRISVSSRVDCLASPAVAGVRAETHVTGLGPEPSSARANGDSCGDCAGGVSAMACRIRSNSNPRAYRCGPLSNNSSIRSDGSLMRSNSDFSVGISPSTFNNTLNFSNPSIFVSPLQASLTSSDDRLVSLSDSETCGSTNLVTARQSFKREDSPVSMTVRNFVTEVLTIATWSVMLHQTLMFLATSPAVENRGSILNQIPTGWFQLLVNSGPHWLTIFFTSAITHSAHALLMLHNAPGGINESLVAALKVIGIKFWKQWPYVFLVVLAWTYVVPVCFEGSLWYFVCNCKLKSPSWTVLLYASNIFPSSAPAQGMHWTWWFVACDMQLYICGIAFTILVFNRPRIGTAVLVGTIGVVQLANLFIAYSHGVVASPIAQYYMEDQYAEAKFGDVFNALLSKPYYYWISYAAGIFMYSSCKNFVVKRRSIEIILNFAAFVCTACLVLVLVVSGLIAVGPNGAKCGPALVNLVQIIWTVILVPLSLAQMIISFQGTIQRFLASSWWIAMSKMNFYCLLTNPLVLACFLSVAHIPIRYSISSVVMYFMASITATYVVIIVLHLAIVGPLASLIRGMSEALLRVCLWSIVAVAKRDGDKEQPPAHRKESLERNISGKKRSKSKSATGSRRFFSANRPFESVFSPELRTKFASPRF